MVDTFLLVGEDTLRIVSRSVPSALESSWQRKKAGGREPVQNPVALIQVSSGP